MTYTLNETFDDPQGRWEETAPWDGTMSSNSSGGFLDTQRHVDLRCFRFFGDVDPSPQDPNLDAVPQTVLDAETQTQMEFQLGANDATENWILTGSGLGAITVGAISSRGGWAGLTATTQAGAIDATLTSSITKAIDITPGTALSIILPDYNAWDTNSYVQLSSDPAGAFGTGHDSTQVTFASNLAVMPELNLAISAFANTGFDATAVTGVRIRLRKASGPGSGHAVTVMGIRSLDPLWQISWLDFDTRIGAICRPVTRDGNVTTGSVAQAFQFVRGDGSKSDPIPADAAMNMFFYPGGSTSPNDATGASFNKVGFIFREVKNIPAATGSHIEAYLQFNDAGTTFVAKFVSTSGGSPGTEVDTGVTTISVGGPLDPTFHYLFRVQIKGTQIIPTIYQVTTTHQIIQLVWQYPNNITNPAYLYRNGRVGFIGNLLSRDAYIDALEVAPTGFAELETVEYASRTPVDGVQLSAIYASDENLFSAMNGTDLVLDSTKTISGNGSYRATNPMQTNTFFVDDWTQMYLNLALWVSNAVSPTNQPQILLNLGSSTQMLPTQTLKASQWNLLSFDLGLFVNLVSGMNYNFVIKPGSNPNQPLGFYWVDDVTIGRRRVSWSVRATEGGTWRDLKGMVNDPDGAVHFTPEERGRFLQLKADALTEDAWVSSFHLFPRYAQLGLGLYDQGGYGAQYDALGNLGDVAGTHPGPVHTAFVQHAIARIKNTLHKVQTATAHIGTFGTKTQGAIARVQKVFLKQQGAVARLANSFTKTQAAKANISGGAGISFLTQTTVSAFNRPLTMGTASRLVPFTTKAGLTTAITNMLAGDYIYYNGTGVLAITTTTAESAFSITGKTPASMVAIDFGTARSYWGATTSANYVSFQQNSTSTNGNNALFVGACSNIAFYGGEFTGTAHGIRMSGGLNNVWFLDQWVHDVAQCGIVSIPSTSGGAVATIQNMVVRAEVGPNWAMNPALDAPSGHPDLGTGMHGALLFDSGNGSSFINNTVAIYVHDSLQPGAVSYGQTWPEGGGGGGIEIGQSPVSGGSGSGNTLYCLAVNNKMIPNGTNPGSTGAQTGGNAIEPWGAVPLTGLVIGWVEGQNLTGGCVNPDASSGWHSTAISVSHGRHTNVNQSHAGSNPTVPYPTISNVTYNDCT